MSFKFPVSIKTIVAFIVLVTAVAVVGTVTGWSVGITGQTGVVIAAVLPVVLAGVGVALYIPFREGAIDVHQAIPMGIFSIVFALSIFLGASVVNYAKEGIEQKERGAIEERLLRCMWLEYRINSARKDIGLRPLDYEEVCL